MARINLLPWREEQRRQKQRQSLMILGASALTAVVAVAALNSFANNQIESQQGRNQYLRTQISGLDDQIAEIEELESTRDRLLNRKQVIEDLQVQRSQAVKVLDELVRMTPVGVTLTSIKQETSLVTLSGTTQSNARVSAYLKNLEDSGLFGEPDLQIIQADQTRALAIEPYDFTVAVSFKQPTHEGAEEFDAE